MHRGLVLTCALLIGTTVVVPHPASAAGVQFGNTCSAAALNGSAVVMTAGSPSNPVPTTAPTTGVITKATFTRPGGSTSSPQRVKILRPTGTPNQFAVVAESAVLITGSGVQTFDVRVPVIAGDLLGLWGPASGALLCVAGSGANTVALFAGEPVVGTTRTPSSTGSAVAVPVVATVEPDADQDGHGDLTQDRCPQLATTQSDCPPQVVVDPLRVGSFAIAQRKSILVLVTTSEPAQVSATGSARSKGRTFTLSGAGLALQQGALGSIKVKLSKALRTRLAALPPSKSIKVKLVVTSVDGSGRSAVDRSTVKLRGTRQS